MSPRLHARLASRRAAQSLFVLLLPLVTACSSEDAPAEAADAATTPDAGAVDDAATAADVPSIPVDGATCPSPPIADPKVADRAACKFVAGAKVADTLGIDATARAQIPITHVIIVMQENRSFDHYFGKLTVPGQTVEGWPATYKNLDATNKAVVPFHAPSSCYVGSPPHQETAMLAGWDNGKMDGFVKSAAVKGDNGHSVMSYFDDTDIPFYWWLARNWSLTDHHHGSALGGTWANRDYLYAATSDGVTDTGERVITVPTIYDALDTAKVKYGVYSDGGPRQDSIGWTSTHPGFARFPAFLAALKNGTLPEVTFVDPGKGQDEHPPADVQGGEAWNRIIYEAAIASPLWSKLAVIFTYDESGGLADHVPPPKACLAAPSQAKFNRLGVRVPLVIVSPYARRGNVSHTVSDQTSITRFVELLHDLPALTARDANANALLDMFDFGCIAPPMPSPPAGTGGCP
ncbi:MAG: Phospholipase 4 precursor [Myxococcaceae bacterium]|nr:Phospholipase 4 precursor [Myxococcaceae bacterium]